MGSNPTPAAFEPQFRMVERNLAHARVGLEHYRWSVCASGEQRRLRVHQDDGQENHPDADDEGQDRTAPLTPRRTTREPEDPGNRAVRFRFLRLAQGSGPAPPRASMRSGCASTVARKAAMQQLAAVTRDRSGVAPMVNGVSSPVSAYIDATSRTTGTATRALAG